LEINCSQAAEDGMLRREITFSLFSTKFLVVLVSALNSSQFFICKKKKKKKKKFKKERDRKVQVKHTIIVVEKFILLIQQYVYIFEWGH
jgi:predicted membrane protein